jgi:uncharacterized protein YegJ (DUF2314 family)
MPSPRITAFFLVAVAGAAAGACKGKKSDESEPVAARRAPAPADAAPADARPVAGPEDPKAGARVAAKPLGSPVVTADYAVIVPAGGDLEGAGQALLAAAKAKGLTVVPPGEEPKTERAVLITVTTPADVGYDPQLLTYFGRGVEADADKIAKATQAIAVTVIGPRAEVAKVHHDGADLARAAAAKAKGWVLDVATMETFSRKAFDEARGGAFALDVQELTVVHMVRGDEGVFLETRGMMRFGLPELYLPRVAQTHAEDVLLLVNATAQALVDKGQITRDGEIDVDLATLSVASWKEVAESAKPHGGSGRVTWTVTWSTGDQDEDPTASILELTAPGGATAEAVREALTAALGTPEDPVVNFDDDPELNAARDRARIAFAKLAPRYAKGVPEGDHLIIKAPFDTDSGGTEWMWVEVTAIDGDKISGILVNDPFDIKGLKNGAQVQAHAPDIFDYLLRKADGTEEGGETNAIMERRQPRP